MHIHNIICVRPLKLRIKVNTLCYVWTLHQFSLIALAYVFMTSNIFSFSNEYIYSSTLVKTPVHHLLSDQPIMWHILQLQVRSLAWGQDY